MINMCVLVENIKIDGICFWDSLMEMVKIGFGIVGGNNCQIFMDEDSEGCYLF